MAAPVQPNATRWLWAAAAFLAAAALPAWAAAQPMTDAGITATVKAQLMSDVLTQGLTIDVQTQSRVVFLTGDVKNRRQAVRAEAIAKRVTGVQRVENHLRIDNRVGFEPGPEGRVTPFL